MMIRKDVLVMVFMFALLSGCGGGGGDGGKKNNVNQPPVILGFEVQPSGVILVNKQVTISANVTDPDGAAAVVNWTQIAGRSVNFTGNGGLSISFDAPALAQDTTLTFSAQATDNDGALSIPNSVKILIPGIGGAVSAAVSGLL